jgi:molybdopterin molybdotransferase
MDGFAVVASDTFSASQNSPVALTLRESIACGEIARRRVLRGSCAEIATGGAMPSGVDAVVMVENTQVEGKKVLVYKSVAPRTNVVARGSDIRKGETVLQKGTVLTPAHLGALAAVGITTVSVRRRVKVVLFSTGSEIVAPGKRLGRGKVFNINSVTLRAALEELGCEVEDYGVVKDTEREITRLVLKGVRSADIVIFSGGSSLGRSDLAPEVLGKLGSLLFHGIAVKPGKPTVAGVVRGKIVIGLPGYPVSALSNVYILVAPLIERMTGATGITRFTRAMLAQKVASTVGRYEFLPVRLEGEFAHPVMRGSSAITTLARAHGFVEIPENVEVVEKGTPVTVRLF